MGAGPLWARGGGVGRKCLAAAPPPTRPPPARLGWAAVEAAAGLRVPPASAPRTPPALGTGHGTRTAPGTGWVRAPMPAAEGDAGWRWTGVGGDRSRTRDLLGASSSLELRSSRIQSPDPSKSSLSPYPSKSSLPHGPQIRPDPTNSNPASIPTPQPQPHPRAPNSIRS